VKSSALAAIEIMAQQSASRKMAKAGVMSGMAASFS